MIALDAKAAENKGPAWIQTTYRLYESTALLQIASGILKRIQTKGLDSEESLLLNEVVPKITQLRKAINTRADKELKGIT